MSADLKIISADETGVIRVGLQRPAVKIQGIEKLVQIVALELLRNGGRNIADPTAGTGLRGRIGTNIEDEAEFFADIRLMVSNGETNIKERQIGTTRGPDERLAQLALIDIVPNTETSEIEMELEVVSEAEERRRARMGIR